MPLKLGKTLQKPFKLFHKHCVKKTDSSDDEEDSVDDKTIEKVRKKLTCKKVGNSLGGLFYEFCTCLLLIIKKVSHLLLLIFSGML